MDYLFELQLFADGGGAGSGAGAAAGSDAGAAAPRQQGNQSAEAPVAGANVETANTDQFTSFDELIKGRYKDQFDSRVQAIVQDRLKSSKAREASLQPMLEAMSKRYGIDPTDAEGLKKAYLEDPEYYREDADKLGISPENAAKLAQVRRYRESQNKAEQERRATEAEQQRTVQNNQHYDRLKQQGEELRKLYPNFDLDTELRNPQFLKMTMPGMGIDVRTAYEAIHRDELRGAEMQYATQRTLNRVSASIQAGQRRPTENGVNRGSVAVNIANDPSKFSRQELKSYADRVMRGGERITWEQLRGGK